MKGIKGQLSSLPITDLIQWIEMNKKSGVLLITNEEAGRCFCFEEGRILLAAANEGDSTLTDFLGKEGLVTREGMKDAVSQCQKDGKSLLNYLADSKMVPKEFMAVALQQLTENVIISILAWEDGSFEFIESLPKIVSGSPVQLSTGFLVFEAVRKYDELKRKQGA